MFSICAVVITILELEKAKPVRGSAVEISGKRERDTLWPAACLEIDKMVYFSSKKVFLVTRQEVQSLFLDGKKVFLNIFSYANMFGSHCGE